MLKTISLDEAKNNLNKLAPQVTSGKDEYVITINGKPAMRLVSDEAYEIDTDQSTFNPIEEMKGYSGKQLMKDLKEDEKEYQKGEYVDWEDLKKELHL